MICGRGLVIPKFGVTLDNHDLLQLNKYLQKSLGNLSNQLLTVIILMSGLMPLIGKKCQRRYNIMVYYLLIK